VADLTKEGCSGSGGGDVFLNCRASYFPQGLETMKGVLANYDMSVEDR